MAEKTVAEVFPPGEFIQDELDSRGWSRADLADTMRCPARVIDEVIAGTREVKPDIARQLGDAFGTGAAFWLNLEASYRRHASRQTEGQGNSRRQERQAV